MAAGAATALGFALGQPYALLDPRAFLHDVVEQSQMVRTAGLFPYTNQYVGVPKGIYDLRELVVWGMGPALGLTALIGLGLALAADGSGAPGRRGAPARLGPAVRGHHHVVRRQVPALPAAAVPAARPVGGRGAAAVGRRPPRTLGAGRRGRPPRPATCWRLGPSTSAPTRCARPPSGSTPTCRPAATSSPRTGTRASRSTCPAARRPFLHDRGLPVLRARLAPSKVAKLAQEVDGRRLHRPADQAHLRCHDPGEGAVPPHQQLLLPAARRRPRLRARG